VTRRAKIGRGVRKGCPLSPILFNLQSEYFTKEALEGFGDFKIAGQVIHTVKYADGLALMLVYNGYRVFSGDKGGRGVTLTTHTHLVPRS
jgi:hypothetical protein